MNTIDFDERAYLVHHPDVLAAVLRNEFPNGRFHYDHHGRDENRDLGDPVSHDEFMTACKAILVPTEIELRGAELRGDWPTEGKSVSPPDNDLRQFCEARKVGAGIWKWSHYLDIYDQFLRRFRNADPHVMEIGVLGGGSLDMWRNYFGLHASIYGVDIDSRCKAYVQGGTRMFIGDQADRQFWSGIRREVPALDVVIDDGGHTPEQQMVTIEELLPHLRPGGIYICEDIHGSANPMSSFVGGLTRQINDFTGQGRSDAPERFLFCRASAFQSAVASLHVYPFMLVVERSDHVITEFIAPRRGSLFPA